MTLVSKAKASEHTVRAAFLQRLFVEVFPGVATHPAAAWRWRPNSLGALCLLIGQIAAPVIAPVLQQPSAVMTSNRVHGIDKFRRLFARWKALKEQHHGG